VGKSPGEHDGQHVRVERFVHGLQHLAGGVAALVLHDELFAAGAHQARAVQLVGAPELFVVYFLDASDVVRSLDPRYQSGPR